MGSEAGQEADRQEALSEPGFFVCLAGNRPPHAAIQCLPLAHRGASRWPRAKVGGRRIGLHIDVCINRIPGA